MNLICIHFKASALCRLCPKYYEDGGEGGWSLGPGRIYGDSWNSGSICLLTRLGGASRKTSWKKWVRQSFTCGSDSKESICRADGPGFDP